MFVGVTRSTRVGCLYSCGCALNRCEWQSAGNSADSDIEDSFRSDEDPMFRPARELELEETLYVVIAFGTTGSEFGIATVA